MQEKFTAAVEKMNESLKEEDSDVESLLLELEPTIGNSEVTGELFMIQEQKAKLMNELKVALNQLDVEGTVGLEGKMQRLTFDGKGNQLQVFGRGGNKEIISIGQLMVAGLWDESYFLDQTVPREIKKQYLIQKTHYQIADLYDHQIALFESEQVYNQRTGRDDSYAAIANRYAEDAEIAPGVMAEKMVESFITKLTYDHKMPYRLKNTSVYEDVEFKIDFLIESMVDIDADRAEGEIIGVEVSEPKDHPDIAIQFTTSSNPLTIERKTRQLEQAKGNIEREDSLQVRDLVIVTLPIDNVTDTFDDWQKTKQNRRTPGGPDELWDEKTKEKIFRGIMDKIFSPDQIESAWSQVESISK